MSSRILIALIRAYRLILSPYIGGQCRFHPTCSRYTEEAIQRFGAWHGTILGIKRIARCHPFCQGGVDPVPQLLPQNRLVAYIKRKAGSSPTPINECISHDTQP